MQNSGEETKARVINVGEAAKMLNLSRARAYAAVRRGEIPAIRVGARWLVPLDRINEMLAGNGEAE